MMDPLQLIPGTVAVVGALYLFTSACVTFGVIPTLAATYAVLWLLSRGAEWDARRRGLRLQ